MPKLKLYVLLSLLFSACNKENKEITSLGQAGEITIIAAENTFKKNSFGIIKNKLTQPQTYLAQTEPYFLIDTVSATLIDENILMSSQILMIKFKDEEFEIDEIEFHKNLNDTDIKLSIQRDIWAYPQVVYLLEAGSEKSLQKYLKEHANELFANFLNSERNNIKKNILADVSDTISQFLNNELKMDLLFPKDFHLEQYISKNDNVFAWIRKETSSMTQGVIIYGEPFKDSSQLTLKNIISRRDSVVKKYIKGATENTFMETELQFPVLQNKIWVNDIKTTEIRGVWKVKNELMGGPFYLITFISNNKIYTIEGFLYAPRSQKTPLLRQLEAIINSLQLEN